MKLNARVKYFFTKIQAYTKALGKVPTKAQVIKYFKDKKVSVTPLQAEQTVDALKIQAYEKSLKAPKAKAQPLAKKTDSKVEKTEEPPVAKVETPVQANQQLATKTTRAYGFKR